MFFAGSSQKNTRRFSLSLWNLIYFKIFKNLNQVLTSASGTERRIEGMLEDFEIPYETQVHEFGYNSLSESLICYFVKQNIIISE